MVFIASKLSDRQKLPKMQFPFQGQHRGNWREISERYWVQALQSSRDLSSKIKSRLGETLRQNFLTQFKKYFTNLSWKIFSLHKFMKKLRHMNSSTIQLKILYKALNFIQILMRNSSNILNTYLKFA